MNSEQDSNWIPSFYKHSNVTGKYSVIDKPEIKDEILYTDYDSTHHIRIMKSFQTPEELKYLNQGEKTVLKEPSQKDFFLRCYLPKNKISRKDKHQRIQHLIVMFNGLNECAKYDFYDVLGAQFAEYGIASILIPTPYHLDRRIKRTDDFEPRSMKKANSKEYELPTDMAYDHPELYIYNFKRSIMEFEALIKRIEKPDPRDCGFFENYFAENLEITLFGFSMGGLRALSCFLRNPDKYHSCITFNSGVNLTKINTTELNLDARSWEDTFTRVESLVENPRFLQNQRENKEILDLFRWLHLGRNQTYLKKRLQDHSYRYLSIQSGADTIFEANNPMGEYVDEHGHGLNRLIIAGVGHVPTMDLKWDNWMSKVGENIVRFIQRCKETYWAHADLEKEIAELIKETQFLKDIKEAAKEDERYFKNFDFSFAVFKELKKQIKSNEKDPKRFEELYYISKAFYPKFSELLEKIAGHRKK